MHRKITIALSRIFWTSLLLYSIYATITTPRPEYTSSLDQLPVLATIACLLAALGAWLIQNELYDYLIMGKQPE